MKKKLTVIVLLCLALLLAACTHKEPATGESPSASSSAQPSVSPSETPTSAPAMSEAEAFLAGGPSAAEVGRYVTDNAPVLAASDGDLLLERLILLQQDLADMMNVRIWDKAYMFALNETMGGVFDAEKIGDIEDEDVKSMFTEITDAVMTVVRYEETPVFEMNWERLEAIGGAFSPEAADMIGYRSRLQGNYYAGDPLDFDLLAADIAAVEDELTGLDGGFIRWQLRKVYTRQISELFIGPEGSFLGEYADDDSAYLARLEQYAQMYGGKFGQLCWGLYEMQGDDSQTVMDFLNGALIFPPYDPLAAEITVSEEDGTWLSLPVISGADAALTDLLNMTVRNTALTMLEDDRTDQTLSTYVTVCGDYMSVTFACSYLDADSDYHYEETGLVLDLTSGESVTLDDIVGLPFADYKDALLGAIRGYNLPNDLAETFAFALTDSGMTISLPSKDGGWPDYYTVTFNGLRSFMDITKLF